MQEVGSFFVNSGEMVVSDPCYELGTWCTGKIPCENGKYKAFIETIEVSGWGERVSHLIVVHESVDVPEDFWNKDSWISESFDVGVDSGQAGFFDASKAHLTQDEDYDDWCKKTLSDDKAGTKNYGVASRSGFGDGGYTCWTRYNDSGKVVAAYIEFIPDEDLDEENYDEENYDQEDEEEIEESYEAEFMGDPD